MKVRRDFVTNSSSSSYIIVSKINYDEELKEMFKQEYGEYGIGLLNSLLVTGVEILKKGCWEYQEFVEYCENNDVKIDENSLYLKSRFYTWTTEGDSNGDDAWLYEHIPSNYIDLIYEGDTD